MIIGIDGNEANIKQRVGVNTYAFEILWGLYKLEDSNSHTKHKFVVYLKSKPLPDMPPENESWSYKILPSRKFWVVTQLMPYLYKTRSKPDTFFTPSHYLPPFCPVPSACSIMDLGYLETSEQFRMRDYWQLKLWTARSLRVAKKVFTISNATADEVVRHYKFARNKVIVTPLGYDKHKFNAHYSEDDVRRVKKTLNLPNNYILFLGTLKPSKNIERLVESWSLIESSYPETKLVIAGKKGWLYTKIGKTVQKLNLEHRTVFTGFVKEQDKEHLIKGARIFVQPSLWEGFGLDVVSAMASGVPVVVSDRGSLPEVVGGAGIIVDPHSHNQIADAIKKVLSMNKKSYNNAQHLGLERAKEFSWEKTAKITLKGLETLK